jgi:membrane-associated phospholipid phosphatase
MSNQNLLKKTLLLSYLLVAQASYAESNADSEKIGDIVQVLIPATVYVTTIALNDRDGKAQFKKAFISNLGITYALKYAIDKPRPNGVGSYSFPSGHTSASFQGAAFIHKRYGFKYSIPAYLLAGFTAATRIDSKKHDMLDVLVGAAIGIGSNFLFTTEYQQKHMELTFNSTNQEYLVGFNYSF